MSQTPIRIIQISDIHLLADTNGSLLGVNTQESFDAVIELVRKEKEPLDLILLSGDLAQDGSEIAYRRLSSLLKVLQIPIYFVPGNHDHLKQLAHVFPTDAISNKKQVIIKNWQLILLNSQVPGIVHGHLERSELDYLEQCLKAYPEHHAIIVFHHQPVPVGCAWLDKQGLTNDQECWQVLSSYPQVNTVLFGHVHQEFEQTVHGIKCYSPPSTCIQFKRKQDKFALENIPPGYRWLNLYADGRIETGIRRVKKYIGVFEENAKGY